MSLALPRSLRPRLGVALLAVLVLTACGGEEDTPNQVAESEGPRVVVEAKPVAERARYALERVFKGPVPQTALPIETMHARSLQLAIRDLVAMPDATLALLADPEIQNRVLGPKARDTNPWHAILEILLELEERPTSLAITWLRPAFEREVSVPLRRLAARLLSVLDGPQVGPLLLEMLAKHMGDRDVPRHLFAGLARIGDPYLREGLNLAVRRGPPRLWSALPDHLSVRPTPTTYDPARASQLAWVGTVLEADGPRQPGGLPHHVQFGWAWWRGLTDLTAPTIRVGAAQERRQGLGPLPAEVSLGAGWMKTEVSDHPIVPPTAWFMTGREPAAEARCALALWGYDAYEHQRALDEALAPDVDPTVKITARHCVAPEREREVRERNLEEFRAFLDGDLNDPGLATRIIPELGRIVGGLPEGQDERTIAVLKKALMTLRPLAVWSGTVDRVAARLQDTGTPMEPYYRELLTSGDAYGEALGMYLLRKAQDPATLGLVDEVRRTYEGRADQVEKLDQYWSLQVHIAARRQGIEPDRLLQFLEDYVRYLREDARERRGVEMTALLATALLDFGPEGADRFASLVEEGPARPYVQAVARRPVRLPLRVAEVLLGTLDDASDPASVVEVLQTAWTTYPPEAASALATTRSRMPKRFHPAFDVALDRVVHRSPARPE